MEIFPNWCDCEYKIVKMDFFEDEDENKFSTTVRINIYSKVNVLKWLEEFQEKNHITLRVLRTYEENSSKIVFKVRFSCRQYTYLT